ncbi:hypothetical protein C8A05DRAFT_36176 [Staphylotrichum tortipilum]|uniref:Uncharacterized protein n=1 Tax=Staphylotrichum tortipilum TaxID=2831512 RepID=A0AAN6MHD4_9PEZI|nr:hypothetical protein C8A05DRAFT_36176 [Staphylotrichum longicolle]
MDEPFDEPPMDEPFDEPPMDEPFDEPPMDEPFDESPMDEPFDEPPMDEPFEEPPIDEPFDEPPIDEPLMGEDLPAEGQALDDQPFDEQAPEGEGLDDQPPMDDAPFDDQPPMDDEPFDDQPPMDDTPFDDQGIADDGLDGAAGQDDFPADGADGRGMDDGYPQDDFAQNDGFQDSLDQNLGDYPEAELYDGAGYGDDFADQPDNGAFNDPPMDEGFAAEGGPDPPMDRNFQDPPMDDLPPEDFDAGGQDKFDQYADPPEGAEDTQSFDEASQDELAGDDFAEPGLEGDGFRDDMAEQNPDEYPLSPEMDGQEDAFQNADPGEAMMSPVMDGMDEQPMSPAPQYDGSEYGPMSPPMDEDVPPMPSPGPMENGFDERGDDQFQDPPLEDSFDDQGLPAGDGFQDPPMEDGFDTHDMDGQGMEMSEPFDEQEQPPFDDSFQDGQDLPRSDDRFQEQFDEFDEQGGRDMEPRDQFHEQPLDDDFDTQDGQDMMLQDDQFQEQPFDDAFGGQGDQDMGPADDQLQEQPFDDFNGQGGEDMLPADDQGFPAEEDQFQDDMLPEFAAPQDQQDFGTARSPSLQGMQEPGPEFQDEGMYPQEPAQDVYYDTDESPSPPQEYQTGQPMEMADSRDEYAGQSEFMAAGHVGRPAGVGKNEKHQWLLPLMATATLGWGMEALEEQYHAANLKASGFSFKAVAAKLFGSKKKDDAKGNKGQNPSAAGAVVGEGSTPDPEDPNDEVFMDAPEYPEAAGQNGEWEDIAENDQPKPKGKRGLFGLLRGKKKQGDLEAQDQPFADGQGNFEGGQHQFADNQDPTMQDDQLNRDAPMGADGYPEDSNMADANANAETTKPKKRGFFAGLFGSKKAADPDGMGADSMDRGMGPEMGDSMAQDMNGQDMNDGTQQRSQRPGFFARLFRKKSKHHNEDMFGQGAPAQRTKKPGFFARLFGKYSKRHNQGGHSFDDGYTKPPKKRGMFAVVFGSGKKTTAPPQDQYGNGVEEYPMEPPGARQRDNEPVQDAYQPDAYDGPDGYSSPQRPKKKSFFARLFGSKKESHSQRDQQPHINAPNTLPQKRGLFARAQTMREEERSARQKKRGFWARLFCRKPKQPNQDDIEMGNFDEGRIGRVRTGSPQLVQSEAEATPRSTAADVMYKEDDNLDDVIPGKKRKKEKKHKKDKKRTSTNSMGLYRQATLSSSNKMPKKGKRQSGVYYGEEASGLTEPREARKAPARVRYAPIVPSSEGMYQHVGAPRQRQRGAGRTAAAAAAANPGNWFWMDVYWK